MSIADNAGFFATVYTESISRHDVILVCLTIDSGFTEYGSDSFIGGKIYNPNEFDRRVLAVRALEITKPHQKMRLKR